jgi:hypothetical protein
MNGVIIVRFEAVRTMSTFFCEVIICNPVEIPTSGRNSLPHHEGEKRAAQEKVVRIQGREDWV